MYLANYTAKFTKDIDALWTYHDIDRNGYLDREEASSFVFEISECIDQDRALNYDPSKFDTLFDRFDENNDLFLSKAEMATFIKKIFTKPKGSRSPLKPKTNSVPLVTPRRKKGERTTKPDSGKKVVSYVDSKYIKYTVSNDFHNPIYDEVYDKSISNKEKFWH